MRHVWKTDLDMDVSLWRYFTTQRFIQLLESSTIYFAAAHQFEDPFEGAVATMYIDRLVMPRDGAGDALHLALASFYSMDVLLTWNCKHLANPNKFGHREQVNNEMGLSTPLMTTPLNYLSEDNSDGD
jgi:hypothetical protein